MERTFKKPLNLEKASPVEILQHHEKKEEKYFYPDEKKRKRKEKRRRKEKHRHEGWERKNQEEPEVKNRLEGFIIFLRNILNFQKLKINHALFKN